MGGETTTECEERCARRYADGCEPPSKPSGIRNVGKGGLAEAVRDDDAERGVSHVTPLTPDLEGGDGAFILRCHAHY